MKHDGTEILVGGGPSFDPEDARKALTEAPVFLPSLEVPFEYGVDYRGAWEDEAAGVQISVRRHAAALASTGMPVWLVSHGHRMTLTNPVSGQTYQGFADHREVPASVLQEVGPILERRHKHSLVMIEHRILHVPAIANLVYPPRARDPEHRERVARTTVLYTVLERATPDDDTRQCAALAKNLAEVWVPCEQNRRVLIDSGLEAHRVFAIPHPIPTGDPVLGLAKAKRLDYTIRFINVGKWEPRKAQHDLIGGFLLAFRPGDPRELIVKYSPFGDKWENYPADPVESVKLWLKDPRISVVWKPEQVDKHVKLYPQRLSRRDLLEFMRQSDVYVSAGRAEGFDLPALDARVLGLHLVVLGFGGAEALAPKRPATTLPDLAPTHPGYNWKGARWSGHTADNVAVELLRAVGESNVPAPFDRTPFTTAAVGTLMLNRILDICQRNGSSYEFAPAKEFVDAFHR
jgi:glycosyltransferase involved in cell wall biosynthesis